MGDQFGVWTAVTEDVCPRGCRLLTSKLPRVGSLLALTLSSDLFAEALEVGARVAWVSDQRVGVTFVDGSARPGGLSPTEWVERLTAHGRVLGPEPVGATGIRLVPAIRRHQGARPFSRPASPPREGAADDVLAFPSQHG